MARRPDPVKFLEKHVVPCADPEQQEQLLEDFEWELTRAFERFFHWSSKADWVSGGRWLRAEVRQALNEIPEVQRRARYNNVVWKVSEKFEARWKTHLWRRKQQHRY